MVRNVIGLALLLMVLGVPAAAAAQDEGKPFDFPVAVPAGASTWLLGQPYGNTTGAFNFGQFWYEAGQRLHFGIDISMPCGTPLVAVANATVMGVDDLGFGSGPHNLILRHDEYGLTTLYGHLLERPNLVNGQLVQRGQTIALSGDPDSTCDSRPHLHLEVRSLDYRTAYNPVTYINAAWHSLSNIGSFSSQSFQRDLDNARRWLTLRDQPDVAFGGRALNAYAATLPPPVSPPANPPLMRTLALLSTGASMTTRRLAYEGCCFLPMWHPIAGNQLLTIDGSEGQRASVFRWTVGADETFELVSQAPAPFMSPDGSHELYPIGTATAIRRLSDGTLWTVETAGAVGALNTDNTQLLWAVRAGANVPGSEPPPLRVWLSSADGSNARQIVEQRGGSAAWLDATRILLSTSERQVTTLSVYDTATGTTTLLGSWERLRGLSVAPGGKRALFYLAYHPDYTVNGIYVLDTRTGTTERLGWFGAWRWRDASSVYYVPFVPTTNDQTLHYYHLDTGDDFALTTAPFTIANGDWSVSADGTRIAWLNAVDLTTWLFEPAVNAASPQ